MSALPLGRLLGAQFPELVQSRFLGMYGQFKEIEPLRGHVHYPTGTLFQFTADNRVVCKERRKGTPVPSYRTCCKCGQRFLT